MSRGQDAGVIARDLDRMTSRACGAWLGAALAVLLGFVAPAKGEESKPTQAAAAAAQPLDPELQHAFGRLLVDRTLRMDPTLGVAEARRILLRRAGLFESVKEFKLAESDLTTAVQMQPPDSALYIERGYFYMRLGRFSEASADFLMGTQLDPANPTLRFAAGRAMAALGDYGQAVTYYDEAIGLAARDPSFYLARAEAQIRLAQPRDAVADYDRAIDIKLPRASDRYYAYVGRGYAWMMLANYASAIADFDRALEIDPRAVSALVWRGYSREMGGQVDLALNDYERAAAVDPTDRRASESVRRLRDSGN